MNRRRESGAMKTIFTAKVLRLAILTYLVLGVILTFAFLKPYPLMEEADPFHPLPIEPDWYLLGARRVLDALPGFLAAVVLVLVPILFLCLPCLDRRSRMARLSASWRLIFALVLSLCFAWLTWGFG